MGPVDRTMALRAGGVFAASLVVLAIVLAATLPRSFFEDWGWAAGPGVWAVCAAITAGALRLPLLPVLAGAAVAGLCSLLGVLIGVHWVGAPFGVLLVALWCGRLAAGQRPPATAG